MNIFYLDPCVKKCAEYHCDKHVVKMILESVQMLSTVIRGSGIDAGYKATHAKHPCTLWAGQSLSNYKWLLLLTKYLNKEYKYRYDKSVNHKSYDLALTLPTPDILDIGLTKHAQAMPDQYKSDDPLTSYRDYYTFEKSNLHKWTKREIPVWLGLWV